MNGEPWRPVRDRDLSDHPLWQILMAWLERHRVSRSAGVFFPNRSHSMDEEDAMELLQCCPTMEAQDVTLEVGEILAVPRGVAHPAEVVGDGPAVSLDGLTMS